MNHDTSKVRSSLKIDLFLFASTLVLGLLYSLLRSTEYSVYVKPLPVVFWFVVVTVSRSKRPEYPWLLFSLAMAVVGDVLLDLGDDWLIVGTIPFLGSTLLLAYTFQRRLGVVTPGPVNEVLVLGPLLLSAGLLFWQIAPSLGESTTIGGVLLILSVLLLWRSIVVLAFSSDASDDRVRRIAGVIGASGIVANYVLYSVNLVIYPIPRDLVIHVYYWGQALCAWSFLRRDV